MEQEIIHTNPETDIATDHILTMVDYAGNFVGCLAVE